jgi:hypothetical protein
MSQNLNSAVAVIGTLELGLAHRHKLVLNPECLFLQLTQSILISWLNPSCANCKKAKRSTRHIDPDQKTRGARTSTAQLP